MSNMRSKIIFQCRCKKLAYSHYELSQIFTAFYRCKNKQYADGKDLYLRSIRKIVFFASSFVLPKFNKK
jgi:hypothetical protein